MLELILGTWSPVCAKLLKLSKKYISSSQLKKNKNNAHKFFIIDPRHQFLLKQPSIKFARILNQKEAKTLHEGTVNFLLHAPESERPEQRL